MPSGRGTRSLLTSLILVTCLARCAPDDQAAEVDSGGPVAVKKEHGGKGRLLLTVDDKPYLQEPREKESLLPNKDSTYTARPAQAANLFKKSEYRQRDNAKPVLPTAPPRPNVSNKKQVEWFEDTHYYALKASIDDRFRIRHAPIPALGSPWPMPQVYQPMFTVFHLDPEEFRIYPIGENCDVLEAAFKRILRNMFLDYYPGEQEGSRYSKLFSGSFFGSDNDDNSMGIMRIIHSLNVTVLKECDGATPQMGMDETYDLEVKKTGASLIAREVWGALRGMETFSQLVYQLDNEQFVINQTYINDYPRFPHRGILLDTSRHYLTKETIITNLELMAQNKMNVFHWHIVDDQSFPFESKVFPDLANKGAYDPVTHIYSHEDIAEIIEEARLRGIRVIPEFDTPGHTYSWGYGQDFLLTPCYDYSKRPDGFYGPINPILKATYRFLNGLFQEVLQVFTDKYVHLGGDEVPFDCWYSNPFLNSFIRRNNLTDVRDLLNLYERKLLDIITKIGKQRDQGSGYIVWQEVFDNGVKLKPDTIVQVWSGDAFDIGRVTGAGLRALFSTCWYLDYTNYGQDWDKYYKCDQIGQMLEDYRVPNQTLLLGGEACLWMEFADDESVLPRLWPRASAAAERLWSNKLLTDVEKAAPRIEEHRCRMIRRGLPVGVLGGPGYCRSSKKATSRKKRQDWKMSSSDYGKNLTPKEKSLRFGNVYVVDVNAIYLIPLLIIVCLCCLLLVKVFLQTESKTRLIAIFNLTPNHLRFKARSLFLIFMVFAVVWCLWMSPMWLHLWETPNATGPRMSVS